MVFVASGDVNSFNAIALRSRILTVYASASDASITVTAASVTIVVKLIFTTVSASDAVETDLGSKSVSQLSTLLSLSVESISTMMY